MSIEGEGNLDENIWRIDSGETQNMTNNYEFLFEIFDIESHITVGNNST